MLKDVISSKALIRCFFLFCSLKDFYNFYEVVGLKWKVSINWVENRDSVLGGSKGGQ